MRFFIGSPFGIQVATTITRMRRLSQPVFIRRPEAARDTPLDDIDPGSSIEDRASAKTGSHPRTKIA
jgi:hypothetical protein